MRNFLDLLLGYTNDCILENKEYFMSNQMPPPQGGDLPVHARERLSIMRGDATHRGLFTSDLSVNESLSVREAGFDPIGLVVGSSICHLRFQFSTCTQHMVLNVLTHAMYHA